MSTIVKDTKIIWNGKGMVYHLYRTRKGVLDTINLSYPIRTGIRTISRKIPCPLGYLLQKFVEVAVDLV